MTADHLPTASLDALRDRARLLRRLRMFFDEREFFEVETPILSHDIVIDRYLAPVSFSKSELTARTDDRESTLWLQTSPEFGMKRLLAGGAQAIYQIGKCFRCGESGARHNPEFTMLEWYRVGDDQAAGMTLLSDLVESVLQRPAAERICYRDLFHAQVNVDPLLDSITDLRKVVSDFGITAEFTVVQPEQQNDVNEDSDQADRDELLNLIMSEIIEPKLGFKKPLIVFDWPASQSALAIVRDETPPVAERFEMYVDGVELANGYHELLDADELARRNKVINELRQCDGSPVLPGESRLLAAMRSGIPGCSGVALGVDRLAMLDQGKSSIAEVVSFTIENA